MRLLLFFALTLLLSTGTAASAGPGANFWRDWDSGLAEANRTGRPVLVDVYTSWCGWCKRMDRDVYSRKDVQALLLEHFVPVKLNAESGRRVRYMDRDFTGSSLAAGFRVTGYPTTIFLRPDGRHMVNVPGYIPADRFQTILRYIGEGHMDRGVDFREFEQQGAPPAP